MMRRKSWNEGTLFHNFYRYAAEGAQTSSSNCDRLPMILEEGLRPPAHRGADGSQVIAESGVSVAGPEIAYDSVVFLHKYQRAISDIYFLHSRSDYICLVLDDTVSTKTANEMGANWPILSQSEVYATEPIAPEHFTDIYLPGRYLHEPVVADKLARLAIQPHEI